MIYVTVSFCNGFSFRVLLFFFLTSGTCKIVLNSNHKEYSVKVKELELPNGMPLKEADLVVGKAILWICKGERPFSGEIIEVESNGESIYNACMLILTAYIYIR